MDGTTLGQRGGEIAKVFACISPWGRIVRSIHVPDTIGRYGSGRGGRDGWEGRWDIQIIFTLPAQYESQLSFAGTFDQHDVTTSRTHQDATRDLYFTTHGSQLVRIRPRREWWTFDDVPQYDHVEERHFGARRCYGIGHVRYGQWTATTRRARRRGDGHIYYGGR